MFGEILPIVPAGINVGFVRNVARAENFVEGCSAGFKAEIVVIAAIKINFESSEIRGTRKKQWTVAIPESGIGRRAEGAAENA